MYFHMLNHCCTKQWISDKGKCNIRNFLYKNASCDYQKDFLSNDSGNTENNCAYFPDEDATLLTLNQLPDCSLFNENLSLSNLN